MTTESIIKIYKAEAYYLPIATTPPELVAELEDEFTYSFYKESACARCPYIEDRPSENCDACESFLGQRATGGRKTIKEKHFLKVPRGGLKKLTNVLRHLGMNDRAKWFDRMPKEHSMSRRIKLASDVKLRDYQVPATQSMLDLHEGVLQSPARSGKTAMAASVICKLNQKTLILASQNEWLFQFRETFIGSETVKAMTTCKPSQIGFPKTLEDFDKYDICLCTLSKFKSANGKKLLEQIKDKFPVVVIDEVHYVPADGCARVIANLNARYIFGLTGSPERKNTAEYQIVEDLVGPIIHEVKMDRARPHVELLPMPAGKKNEFQIKGHGPYAFTTLVSKLEASTVRKIAICDKAIQLARSGHMVLIPLTRVNSILEYTRYINEKVDRPKYALPFYGKIKKEDRMKVIDAARNYKCKILVGNIALLSVGLNIPRASAIIECGINSNSPACKQRLARVLTPMDDKPTPLFVFTLDECDIMRKCRRTEWWNTITPTFKPVVNSETKKTLNAYFAASSSSVKAKKGIYAHINLNEEL